MKDYRSLEQKIRQVVREAEENRNTEARKKVANVGRPEGESKLAKQGEIKTKIIDEAGPETQPKEPKDETKDKKPAKDKDTVDATKITGGKTEVDLEPRTDDRSEDGKKMDDKAKISTKKANREGGVQEETHMFKSDNKFGLPEDLIAAVTEAMKGKCPKCGMSPCQCGGDPKKVEEELKGGQKKLDKNHNGKLDKKDFEIIRGKKSEKMKAYRADRDKHMEEEVEELDELSKKTLGSYINKATADVADSSRRGGVADAKKAPSFAKGEYKTAAKRQAGIYKATNKLTKEETDPGFSAEEIARIEEIAKSI